MDTVIRPGIFDEFVRAFFTRKGVGADPQTISNYLAIGTADICMPIQRHTDIVWLVSDDRTPMKADAVVTRKKGILIGVQVADCVPVLLHDREKSAVGAVHAGWRGTSLQIIRKTISFMTEKFGSDPHDIRMAFGPSIRSDCYCVDSDVRDAVLRASGPGEYVVPQNGKFYLDLTTANVLQALSEGIPSENIWTSPECTCCNPRDFHSFRYHGNYAGRQGGFIGIFEKCSLL